MARNADHRVQTVEGSRDYLPKDIYLEKWLSRKIETVLENYGFEPWDAPLLEYRDLYKPESNEDLVRQFALTFENGAGPQLVLRPELTPSLARVIASHFDELEFPLRWYSFGQFWRNEAPRMGRGREFKQWNIDAIGLPSPLGDVEMVLLAIDLLRNFGFAPHEVKIHLNNRSLLKQALAAGGFREAQYASVLRLLDKIVKESDFQLVRSGAQAGFNGQEIESLQAYLADAGLWKGDELIAGIFRAAAALGWEDYLEYDPKLVRFPLYYTGLVFEAYDTQGRYPAILGGGRYDDLVYQVGGRSIPGVGFGVGNLTLSALLKDFQRLPANLSVSSRALIVPATAADVPQAQKLAGMLHRANIKAELSAVIGRQPALFDYCTARGIENLAVVEGLEKNSMVEMIDLKERKPMLFHISQALNYFAGQTSQTM